MDKEAILAEYARRIKAIKTVMRMEIDYSPHLGWMVTITDQRWSLQRGIADPSLEKALRETYEDLS